MYGEKKKENTKYRARRKIKNYQAENSCKTANFAKENLSIGKMNKKFLLKN